MCIKSDNTLALGIIKNNDLALRARSLFLIIPRAWALSYTECLIDEDEIVEVVQPEQSAQCPPEHTSHPTGNECLIVEGETGEIVQPEQSSQCPPEHTNHPTGNVYQNPNRLGDQSARPCVVLIGDSIIKNIIPQKLLQ
jgi:hypothetical protein